LTSLSIGTMLRDVSERQRRVALKAVGFVALGLLVIGVLVIVGFLYSTMSR